MNSKNRLNLQIRTQPVKRALCIGVRYDHLPELHADLRLASTYADVDRVKGLLIGKHDLWGVMWTASLNSCVDRFGYLEDDVKVLKDDDVHEAPTRDNMVGVRVWYMCSR